MCDSSHDMTSFIWRYYHLDNGDVTTDFCEQPIVATFKFRISQTCHEKQGKQYSIFQLEAYGSVSLKACLIWLLLLSIFRWSPVLTLPCLNVSHGLSADPRTWTNRCDLVKYYNCINDYTLAIGYVSFTSTTLLQKHLIQVHLKGNETDAQSLSQGE